MLAFWLVTSDLPRKLLPLNSVPVYPGDFIFFFFSPIFSSAYWNLSIQNQASTLLLNYKFIYLLSWRHTDILIPHTILEPVSCVFLKDPTLCKCVELCIYHFLWLTCYSSLLWQSLILPSWYLIWKDFPSSLSKLIASVCIQPSTSLTLDIMVYSLHMLILFFPTIIKVS